MDELIKKALELGAADAKIIDTSDLRFDAIFRKYCEDNKCGFYGKNYMCPPEIGTVERLREKVLSFDKGIYFQTISPINGFSDKEGLEESALRHNNLANDIKKYLKSKGFEKVLALATKCRYCPECCKVKGEACIHPDVAVSCLSAYCIDVIDMANKLSMEYKLGDTKIAYFGLVLFK